MKKPTDTGGKQFDWVRRRRPGNWVLFLVLLGVALLFYAIAVARMMQAHSIG